VAGAGGVVWFIVDFGFGGYSICWIVALLNLNYLIVIGSSGEGCLCCFVCKDRETGETIGQ
jgi:hypothetical protein